MNNLKVFHSPEFGKLEIVMIDGKEHFPATDVAKTLSYANPHEAVINHCRSLAKREVPHPQSPDKLIERNFIPEGDVYRLIISASSQEKNPEAKEKAEKFERWVFDEVLPDIRPNHHSREGIFSLRPMMLSGSTSPLLVLAYLDVYPNSLMIAPSASFALIARVLIFVSFSQPLNQIVMESPTNSSGSINERTNSVSVRLLDNRIHLFKAFQESIIH